MLPRTTDKNRPALRTARGLEHLEARTLLSAAFAPMPFVGPHTGVNVPIESPILVPEDPMASPQFLLGESWSSLIRLDEFRADSRFSSVDGHGFTSVLIDGGADLDHPFFGPDLDSNGIADRIVYQEDFADNDLDASAAADHGSNVASVVGSQDATYPGVAPGVSLVILKVFTNAGAGNFAMVEEALRWVINNIDTYHIASVNISLGDSQNHAANLQRYGIGDEFETLAQQNVKVTASAGNAFYTFNSQVGTAYPAADPNVIGVGAVFATTSGSFRAESGATAYATSPDQIAPFSQRAESLTGIFAPGVGVTGANRNGGTITMSGTSQAAPIIAGLAVLADQLATTVLGRELTLGEFRSIITSTGVAITDGDDENDNVDNSGLRFRRVDAMAMAEAILAMADISSPNRAPTLTTVSPLTRAIPGRPFVVTYERLLAASNAGDADGDGVRFRIEGVLAGSLLKDGGAVVAGTTTLLPGEHLIWKPATVRAGRTDAFTVLAYDGALASAGAVTVGIIAGPTVFGITSRLERENRGHPSPTSSGSIFARGSIGRNEDGAFHPADPGGWSRLVGRHVGLAGQIWVG